MATTPRSIVPPLSFLSTLVLLAALLQSPPVVSTKDDIEKELRQNRYFDSICFPSVDGISPAYRQNLDKLLQSLVNSTPSTGFNYTSVGQAPNTVYGFAQCRGDVPPDICRNCTVTAIKRVRAECPSNSSAMLWLEACFLRFSGNRFFGSIERSVRVLWTDPNSEMSTESNGEALVYPLVTAAANHPELFATMVAPKDGYTIYGLAECTRDLTSADCAACFQYAIGEIGKNHSLGRVWRFVCPSCVILHYAWPFFLTPPTLTADPVWQKWSMGAATVETSLRLQRRFDSQYLFVDKNSRGKRKEVS